MPSPSPSPSPSPAGKVYALFIGINTYPDGMELQYCAGDAAGMKGCLAPSPLWSSAEITTLLDGQATKTGIQDALGAIAAKAGPADTFLFYYAGHGGASGSNVYIFPVDTTWETDTAISDTELRGWLGALDADMKKVVIFDSCSSGGFINRGRLRARYARLRDAKPRTRVVTFADSLESLENAVILAACKGSESSWEDDVLEHGVFTYYLMEGLGAAAAAGDADADRDLAVTAEELFTYGSSKTAEFTEGLQNPQVLDGCEGEVRVKGE